MGTFILLVHRSPSSFCEVKKMAKIFIFLFIISLFVVALDSADNDGIVPYCNGFHPPPNPRPVGLLFLVDHQLLQHQLNRILYLYRAIGCELPAETQVKIIDLKGDGRVQVGNWMDAQRLRAALQHNDTQESSDRSICDRLVSIPASSFNTSFASSASAGDSIPIHVILVVDRTLIDAHPDCDLRKTFQELAESAPVNESSQIHLDMIVVGNKLGVPGVRVHIARWEDIDLSSIKIGYAGEQEGVKAVIRFGHIMQQYAKMISQILTEDIRNDIVVGGKNPRGLSDQQLPVPPNEPSSSISTNRPSIVSSTELKQISINESLVFNSSTSSGAIDEIGLKKAQTLSQGFTTEASIVSEKNSTHTIANSTAEFETPTVPQMAHKVAIPMKLKIDRLIKKTKPITIGFDSNAQAAVQLSTINSILVTPNEPSSSILTNTPSIVSSTGLKQIPINESLVFNSSTSSGAIDEIGLKKAQTLSQGFTTEASIVSEKNSTHTIANSTAEFETRTVPQMAHEVELSTIDSILVTSPRTRRTRPTEPSVQQGPDTKEVPGKFFNFAEHNWWIDGGWKFVLGFVIVTVLLWTVVVCLIVLCCCLGGTGQQKPNQPDSPLTPSDPSYRQLSSRQPLPDPYTPVTYGEPGANEVPEIEATAQLSLDRYGSNETDPQHKPRLVKPMQARELSVPRSDERQPLIY